MQNNEIRTNTRWVSIIAGRSREKERYGVVDGRFVQFDILQNSTNKDPLPNTKENAIWHYLNKLDFFSTMSSDRMINADDISPKELLNIIPYVGVNLTGSKVDV